MAVYRDGTPCQELDRARGPVLKVPGVREGIVVCVINESGRSNCYLAYTDVVRAGGSMAAVPVVTTVISVCTSSELEKVVD